MLAVVVGIVGALVYGSADFLGGIASKRIPAITVTGISAAVGLALLLVTAPFVGGELTMAAVLWGALSGLASVGGIGLLYACLAIGPMSILSPLTAVVSALVPVTFGLVSGERLAGIGYSALGVALVAVVLVGFVPDKEAIRPTLKGMVMAIGSGASLGIFFILLDRSPTDSGLVPLVVNRATITLVVFAAISVPALVSSRASRMARSPASRPRWLPALALAAACGVLDAGANVALLIGLRIGELAIQSVLTALYPAGTIILAAVVLGERITRFQLIGLGLAVAAAATLSLA